MGQTAKRRIRRCASLITDYFLREMARQRPALNKPLSSWLLDSGSWLLAPGSWLLSLLRLLPALLSIIFAANASARPTMAEVVAQTENAFSARCLEIGIRDSFLEYFAPDAIHFDPEPRLARPDLEREAGPTNVRLSWKPRIVRVANTGQLAVSTGPYVLQSANGKSSSGYFLSMWRRQIDGAWKVVADIGVSAPPPTDLSCDFQPDRIDDEAGQLSDLLKFEREQFGRASDLGGIYRAIGSEETVFERTGEPLLTGTDGYAAFLSAQKSKRTKLAQTGGYVYGNLGFTYGTQSNDKSAAGYLRVWILSQSHWRLLFDVVAAALGE
jgi:ketosteroid isomerase-like protein